jgi:hypothetical protein
VLSLVTFRVLCHVESNTKRKRRAVVIQTILNVERILMSVYRPTWNVSTCLSPQAHCRNSYMPIINGSRMSDLTSGNDQKVRLEKSSRIFHRSGSLSSFTCLL